MAIEQFTTVIKTLDVYKLIALDGTTLQSSIMLLDYASPRHITSTLEAIKCKIPKLAFKREYI